MCRMKKFSTVLFLAGLFLLLTTAAGLAWPTDNTINQAVCSDEGIQAQAQIVPTSDGGCYVTWFSVYNDNYNLWIQRYDVNGDPQWGEGEGLPVNEHPQPSWITFYTLLNDGQDNAIVVMNDCRSYTGVEPGVLDWEIYAYKIAMDGTFAWGEDGITLTENSYADMAPRACLTDAGNVMLVWQRMTTEEDQTYEAILCKLDANGDVCWRPAEKILTDATSVSWPCIVSAESDNFMLLYQTGTAGDMTMHLQKYDVNGDPLWGDGGYNIVSGIDLPFFNSPKLVNDLDYGVYVVWFQGTNAAMARVFAQRVKEDGSWPWGDTPLQVTTTDWVSEYEPEVVPYASFGGGGAMIFFKSQVEGLGYGIRAQTMGLNDGARQLGDDAMEVAPYTVMHDNTHIRAARIGFSEVCFTAIRIDTEFMDNCLVYANKYDFDGQEMWETGPALLSRAPGLKSELAVTAGGLGMIAVWQDARSGMSSNPDIYMHSLDTDGRDGGDPYLVLKDVVDNPYLRVLPWDVTVFLGNFHTPRNGTLRVTIMNNDQVYREFDLSTNAISMDDLALGVNNITLHLVDGMGNELDPQVDQRLTATYNPNVAVAFSGINPEIPISTLPVDIELQVDAFDLGVEGKLELSAWFNNDLLASTLTDQTEWQIDDLGEGYNDVYAHLVRMDGSELTPPLVESIRLLYIPSDVQDNESMPHEFALHPAHPNPFNQQTTLRYELPGTQQVRITLYDMLGREVARLVDGKVGRGEHKVTIDAAGLSSGIYFARMQADGFHATSKLVLLK